LKVNEHLAFKNLDIFLVFLDQNKPEKSNLSGQEYIVLGLFNKVISNVKAIRNLIQDHFLEESIIIIRSIYEASLYLNYFLYREDCIEKYVSISYAYSLRNWLFLRKAISILDPTVAYPINNDESDKYIQLIQSSLKESKHLNKASLTDDVLNDPKEIYKRLIKCNDMPSVDNIKNFLMQKEPEVFKSLDVLHTRLYFQTSESVHSGFSTVQSFHINTGNLPQFNFLQIMSSIAFLLYVAMYATTQLKLLPFSFDEAKKKLNEIITSSTKSL
jgi:hypothetical protein